MQVVLHPLVVLHAVYVSRLERRVLSLPHSWLLLCSLFLHQGVFVKSQVVRKSFLASLSLEDAHDFLFLIRPFRLVQAFLRFLILPDLQSFVEACQDITRSVVDEHDLCSWNAFLVAKETIRELEPHVEVKSSGFIISPRQFLNRKFIKALHLSFEFLLHAYLFDIHWFDQLVLVLLGLVQLLSLEINEAGAKIVNQVDDWVLQNVELEIRLHEVTT